MKCCRATQPKVDLELPDASLEVESAEDWRSRLAASGHEELRGGDELQEVSTSGTRGTLAWTLPVSGESPGWDEDAPLDSRC